MRYPLYLLLLLGIVSCRSDERFATILNDADSLIIEAPDSAYNLQKSQEFAVPVLGEAQRMRYALLLSDAQNKSYVDFTTDSVMRVVADYYETHGTPNERMRANYLLGCTYRDLKDVPMELHCFQEAVEKADTSSMDCDFYTLAAIYGQMAELYHKQMLPEEELKALDGYGTASIMANDQLSTIQSYELRMRPYYLMGCMDSVIIISRTSRERYLQYGDTVRAARTINPLISIFIDRGQYGEAEKYIRIFEAEAQCYDEEGRILPDQAMFFYEKGRYLLHEEMLDSSLYCFRELLGCGYKEAAYKGLLAYYERMERPDSISKYAKLFAAANDSGTICRNSQVIERMTAMYNYGHQMSIAEETSRENAEISQHNELLTICMILTVAIATIALVLILYGNYRHRIRKQYEMGIIQKRYINATNRLNELEEQKQSLLETQERSRNKISNYEGQLQNLQKEIYSLKEEISSFQTVNNNLSFEAWFAVFCDCEIVNKLRSSCLKISPNSDGSISNRDWQALIRHFNSGAPGFCTLLNNEYQLNELDMKIALLAVIGFANNDIAMMTSKTAQHISNIRRRILNRIAPEAGSPKLLRKCLLQILSEYRG